MSTLLAVHGAARAVGEPYEIIVVDDASTDRTASLAEHAGARVIRVAHRQIGATRNSGAREARGDLLFFVDADTLVNEAVVRGALAAMRGGAVGGGAMVGFDLPVPMYALALLPILVGIFRVARLACGCFLFCTRDAFGAVGGFDETLFGAEEVVMSRALRRQGRFVILDQSLTTSGRKLRAYSSWEILRVMGRLALGGFQSLRDRRAMDLWYGERREDPKRVA